MKKGEVWVQVWCMEAKLHLPVMDARAENERCSTCNTLRSVVLQAKHVKAFYRGEQVPLAPLCPGPKHDTPPNSPGSGVRPGWIMSQGCSFCQDTGHRPMTPSQECSYRLANVVPMSKAPVIQDRRKEHEPAWVAEYEEYVNPKPEKFKGKRDSRDYEDRYGKIYRPVK